MKGVFAVYKPEGVRSFEVVERVRRLTGEKKVGHGGALDPLAEGVLIIAVGKEYTRKLKKFLEGEKEYIATIRLGVSSPTLDREGEIVATTVPYIPDKKDVLRALKSFEGKIQQLPPLYSNIKIGGKRAREWIKQGKIPSLKPRTVEILEISLLRYEFPFLEVKIRCGKGVYIRSLARDIAKELGTDGILWKLVRTKVAGFSLTDAVKLDKLEDFIKNGESKRESQGGSRKL